MHVDLESEGLGHGLELVRGGLSGVLGDDQAADLYPPVEEGVHQPEDLQIVSYADVLADLVLDDVVGVYDDDGLGIVAQLHEHPDLAVRVEPGEYAGCVVVVEELASELEIKLASELRYAFPDVLRLGLQVEVVVKTHFHGIL